MSITIEQFKQTQTIMVRKSFSSGAYEWYCPTHGWFNHTSLDFVKDFMERKGYTYKLEDETSLKRILQN